MRLQIDLLGNFVVRRDGQVVSAAVFGGQLAQRLVRVLAVRRGEIIGRDALIDALWEEHPPADPAANLNAVVNRARRGLGDSAAVETGPGGYRLSTADEITVDAEQLAARLQTARTELDLGHSGRALTAVEAALTLWRGEPLPEDVYADWAQPHRDRLERIYQELLESGATVALAIGNTRRAGDLAARAVSRQPLREVAHLLHIRALAAGGDTAAAVAAFDALRRRLADELGIDPSRQAVDLLQQLLRGEVPAGAAAVLRPPHARTTSTPPLVGRDHELAALSAIGQEQQIGLLSGRAGSGKSSLLETLGVRTDRRVLRARAVLPEREVPWSLARALLAAAIDAGVDPDRLLSSRARTALADLVPELTTGAVEVSIDAESRRALTLESGAELVCAVTHPLVIVDDLQWADPSSLDLLAIAAGRNPDLALVLAYRPEEVPDDREVATFLSDLQAMTRPLAISLRALDPASVEQLVADAELAALLAHTTDGTPFAILEVVRQLEQQHRLRRVGDVWRPVSDDVLERARTEVRAGQRRSIIARADRQPRVRRELLGLLSLLGRPAPTQLLAAAARLTSWELDNHLEGLVRAGLVQADRHGWRTAHDLVGETLAERLDLVDRTRLHQGLARALDPDVSAIGERAQHLAGAGDWPAAAASFAAAAQQQTLRFADREAAGLAEAGLALDPPEPIRAQLLEVRAETRFRGGSIGAAREDLRAALTLATHGADRVRLLAQLALMASGADDLVRASNLVDLALAEAGDEPGPRARALATAAVIDMNLDDPQPAEARYAEALALFERIGDARGVADVLDGRAMATFLGGDITAGATACDRVAQMFADAGNLLRAVTPRSTHGHALVFAGQPTRGLAQTEAALELARALGNPEGQAFAQWHRSEALAACGRTGDGRIAAEEALAVAEQICHRGWTATALLALGLVEQADGDLDEAQRAFRRSLAMSEHLPLFASWGHARLARALIGSGHVEQAAMHVEHALRTGPPLGRYEARLARCELAVARNDDNAVQLIVDAEQRAAAGGHHASLRQLTRLGQLIPERRTGASTPGGQAQS